MDCPNESGNDGEGGVWREAEYTESNRTIGEAIATPRRQSSTHNPPRHRLTGARVVTL